MRKVDKYSGIPGCLVLSGFDKVARIFLSKKQKDIKKILFLQISEMGSTISAYPLIKKTKELYPKAEIYYLIFKEMQDSVHLLDIIPEENIITITQKSFFSFTKDTLKAIRKIRKMKIDAIIDLELFSRFSSILSYMLKARYRVGFFRYHMEGLYRGNMLTHKVIYNHLKHISHNFLSLIYALKQDIRDTPKTKIQIDEKDITLPKIRSTKEEKIDMLKKLKQYYPNITANKKIIIINPNASQLLPLRRWPLQNYITLCKELIKDPEVVLVITGVRSEIDDAKKICVKLNTKRCINLVGKTSLKELLHLYNISKLLISNDSGPPNFASLTDINVMVFFGPETPVCYKPLGKNVHALYANFMCSPCVSAYNHRKSTCNDNRCLKAITPEYVYQYAKKLI